MRGLVRVSVSFFNDTATTEIYALSLHDALPILALFPLVVFSLCVSVCVCVGVCVRSEEHTSELQSHLNLVCRLLLENRRGNGMKRSTLICRMCHSSLQTQQPLH